MDSRARQEIIEAFNRRDTCDFIVKIKCDTTEQAKTVMTERLGFDEDYGFDYEIVNVSVPCRYCNTPTPLGMCDRCTTGLAKHD